MNASLPYSPTDTDPRNGMTPAVAWLLAVNVGIYFLQVTLFGSENVSAWFSLASETFPSHWWAVVTYMFVHANLMHLAANMVALWMFGPRMERVFGTRAFTHFYFWCGLGGAIFQLLFVRNGGVIGASGAVVGVVLAYALRWPDDDVYLFAMIPMKTRWLAVWTIAINVSMALATLTGYANSTTAWMTHVGGLVFAWLYLNAPLGPSLERIRRHVAMVPDDPEPHPIPKVRRPQRFEESEMEPDHGGVPRTTDEVIAQSNALVTRHTPVSVILPLKAPATVESVNTLLDKISRDGLQSLTPHERQLLEDFSRHLRDL